MSGLMIFAIWLVGAIVMYAIDGLFDWARDECGTNLRVLLIGSLLWYVFIWVVIADQLRNLLRKVSGN